MNEWVGDGKWWYSRSGYDREDDKASSVCLWDAFDDRFEAASVCVFYNDDGDNEDICPHGDNDETARPFFLKKDVDE